MTTPQDWQTRADRWAAEAVADGQPTAWFERLWAAGRDGDVTMPWDHTEPHPVLAEWLTRDHDRPTSGRAVVVGCGLGADAEGVAAAGFTTVGFDLSGSAIAEAISRHEDSSVEYVVADLLDPPAEWARGFDLVVEIYTVQAVPRSMRPAMTRAVTDLVAPGGSLLAIQMSQESTDTGSGPPWPLRREEMTAFAAGEGLDLVSLEAVEHPGRAGLRLWRAHVRRR